METEFKIKCPTCDGFKEYSNENSYRANLHKKMSSCKKCKHKQHSLKLKGKKRAPFSEEWRKNIGDSHKKSEVWKKSMSDPEYRKLHRENKLGKLNFMYGKTHSVEVKHKLKNVSESLRQSRRENRLKQIKESGKFTSFNRTSCEYFWWLNTWMGWNGKYALNGGEVECVGYSLDYYEESLNLVIEWDEPKHYKGDVLTLKDKDIIRMNRIIKHLGCRFFRYNEKRNELKEYKLC